MSKNDLKPEFPKSPKRGLLMTDNDYNKTLELHCDGEFKKIELLCQHYGIPDGPAKFYSLALTLARNLYPAKKKVGRKSKWTDLNKGALVVEVERLIDHNDTNDTNKGVSWATTQLAEKEPWKSFLETKDSENSSPDPAEALRQVYANFKNDRWAELSRDVFAKHKFDDSFPEWDAIVTDVVRNPHPL